MALCVLIIRDNPAPGAQQAIDFEWHSCPELPGDVVKHGTPAQTVASALIGLVKANAQGTPNGSIELPD